MRDRILVHLAWTTRDRLPLINMRVATFLVRFLPAIAQQERARVLEMGIVRTHLHLLVRLHPSTNIPRLLQRLKGGSSVIANREGHVETGELKWAKGYNIESVSWRALDRVAAYVRNQARHHPAEAIPGWPAAPTSLERQIAEPRL